MVKHGPLEWVITKRYSEFAALHNRLLSGEGEASTGMIDKRALPKLPPKRIRSSLVCFGLLPCHPNPSIHSLLLAVMIHMDGLTDI